MRLRHVIGTALVAGVMATGAVATAAPTAESAGDRFFIGVDDGSEYNSYFSIEVNANTGGKVDCNGPIVVTVRTGVNATTDSWSSSPTLCPEDAYTVSVRNDLPQPDSWATPVRVSVTYPSLKRGKGGRQPMLLEAVTTKYYQYGNSEDTCRNVGTIGRSVTCDLASGQGRG